MGENGTLLFFLDKCKLLSNLIEERNEGPFAISWGSVCLYDLVRLFVCPCEQKNKRR